MSMFPSALKRAQEEVDRVIGGGRLPRVSDRPRLPYIEAMVKETLRWQNVVPTGMYVRGSLARHTLTELRSGTSCHDRR